MTGQALRRLLLIEDDPTTGELVRHLLLGSGGAAIEMTHATSMAEAEALLATVTFDVILLDPGLPDSRGIDTIRRAHAAAPRVTIVVLTGQDDEAFALQALQEGAQDYLVKGQIEIRGLPRFLRYAVERHGLEDDLRASEERARVALRTLELSNRELQNFVSSASHDLQEPLRKIQAFGDRLEERASDSLDAEAGDYVRRMTRSAGRMQALIKALVEYSQVTIGPGPDRAVDLNRVVASVLADLAARIAEVHASVEVGPLPTVEAEPLQMQTVFFNLLDNALKFQPDGARPTIRISATLSDDGMPTGGRPSGGTTWKIRVQDTGIGFPAAHREKIFGPFNHVADHRVHGGLGMGLAICRRIVVRSGGMITASSEPGLGATFLVTLPAMPVARMQGADLDHLILA